MKNLIQIIENAVDGDRQLPFSVYTSVKEQRLLDVPVVKPLLVAVLGGNKELGVDEYQGFYFCEPSITI